MTNTNMGILFKRIREQSGLTQQQFADMISYDRRTWQRKEREGTDSITELCFLAEHLNFDPAEFLKECLTKSY